MATHHASGAGRPGRDELRRLRLVFWVAVVVLAAVVIAILLMSRAHRSSRSSSASALSSGGEVPPVASWRAGARVAPGFELVDQRGSPVSLAAFHGRPVIVTFIDPLCRNLCPLEAKQLNEMARSLPVRSRPAIIGVSVDVYGDARANLRQDVSKWSLVSQWRWAVGSPAELARVWRRYQIAVLVTTKRIAGVTVHEITHTEEAYVIDSRGYERAVFLWPFRAQDVLALVRRLTPRTSQPS